MAYQVELLQTVVLGKNESNPLPALIADTVRRVRRDIGSGKNPLSSDDTLIPPELRPAACALILENLQVRIPSMKLSQGQLRAADIARRELADIAAGKVAVLRPLHPEKNTRYGQGYSLLRLFSRRRVCRKNLRGL
jgi:hypothetical protein